MSIPLEEIIKKEDLNKTLAFIVLNFRCWKFSFYDDLIIEWKHEFDIPSWISIDFRKRYNNKIDCRLCGNAKEVFYMLKIDEKMLDIREISQR